MYRIDECIYNEAKDGWFNRENRFNKDGMEYGLCHECGKRSSDIGDIEDFDKDGKSLGYVCEECHAKDGG
jgi:DNA-directed RNA polymerase subunit RPC12/RpoP